MIIYYDKEHDACAVKFSKDDSLFIYYEDDGIEIHSCKGGKPKIVNKQLLFDYKDKV